jgi:uncharacterized membrane protein YbaN (DUF454 family)
VRLTRGLYVTLGSISAGVGLVAVFIPGLPTTVFLLIALWFFTKASPRMEAWLRGHRILGPYLRDWERDRSVPRHIKVVAGLAMLSTVLVAWWVVGLPTPVLAALAVTLAVVLAWIAGRPEPVAGAATEAENPSLV